MKGVLSVLESKTMWINALTLLVGYSGMLPANKYTLAGLAVANLALRLLTNKPIVISETKPAAIPVAPVV